MRASAPTYTDMGVHMHMETHLPAHLYMEPLTCMHKHTLILYAWLQALKGEACVKGSRSCISAHSTTSRGAGLVLAGAGGLRNLFQGGNPPTAFASATQGAAAEAVTATEEPAKPGVL